MIQLVALTLISIYIPRAIQIGVVRVMVVRCLSLVVFMLLALEEVPGQSTLKTIIIFHFSMDLEIDKHI